MAKVRHHFTVDVEEYYHASALEPYFPRSAWSSIESRLRLGMTKLLALLDTYETRGTFFVLGVVAERHPELVRELAAAGHEIASHGWDHRRVTHLTPAEFRAQAKDSRACLEDVSGKPVLGYRAPTFSIQRGREWALDILVEEGYRYDSSLYPVRRPGYGYAGGRRDIHVLELAAGPLVEVPPATFRFGWASLPAGGGGTFRHLPYRFTRSAFQALERTAEGLPGTFYLHPWELDPEQPRVAHAPLLTRLRHYRGISLTESRVKRFLEHFRFQPIAETLAALRFA